MSSFLFFSSFFCWPLELVGIWVADVSLQDDDGAYGEVVAGHCEVVGAGEDGEGC